jgi:hypothetical protein
MLAVCLMGIGLCSLARSSRDEAAGAVALSNWGGFVALDASEPNLHGSIASWDVPTVTCPSSSSSTASEWAGIGGDYVPSRGKPVETLYQTGTNSGCRSGKAFYGAWQQQFGVGNLLQQLGAPKHPPTQIPIAKSVLAGDTMTASVIDRGLLTHWSLVDVRSGHQVWRVTGFWRSDYSHKHSAECIVEDPEILGSTLKLTPLANFGRVQFSTCEGVTPAGVARSLDAATLPGGWTLHQSSISVGTTTLAYPALHPFSVIWGAPANATLAPAPTPAPDFSNFSGQWYAHARGVTINASGAGTYGQPDSVACPTCGTAGAPINTVAFQLNSVSGSTAIGTITSATDDAGYGSDGTTVIPNAYAPGSTITLSIATASPGLFLNLSTANGASDQLCDMTADDANQCGA